MRKGWGGWQALSLTARVSIVTLTALLLTSLGNFAVTFSGPPPYPRPMPIDELLPVLARDRPLSRLAFSTRIERGAAAFSGQPGEVRVPAAEARIDDILSDCEGCVRLTVDPAARIARQPRDAPLAIREGFSLGIRRADGTWSIARYRKPPLITAWHLVTLMVTLGLAAVLGAVAFLFARSIVGPLRRLGAEADRVVDEHDGIAITVGGPPEVTQVAQAVAAMHDRLAHLIETRTQMLAAIAHDMAAPVSRLQFRLHDLPDDARAGAEHDLRELAALIGSILDYARGAAPLRAGRVDLARLCAETALACDPDRARLHFESGAGNHHVMGDRLALQRLIGNLATNALRYAGGGTLRVEAAGEAVVVRMTDSGPGFPPDLADRLFEPFFRVEGSRSRDTAGTGLGLATARDIAKAHGGTLVAENRPEGGAQFVLRLPRAGDQPA